MLCFDLELHARVLADDCGLKNDCSRYIFTNNNSSFSAKLAAVGSLWKRFVGSVLAENDSSRAQNPLNRNAAEWSRLTELTSSLISLCPPSRRPILEFAFPIASAYLSNCQPQISGGAEQSSSAVRRRKRGWQQQEARRHPPHIRAAESFLLTLIADMLDICSLQSEVASSEFSSRLCAWSLDLLARLSPPPQWNVLSASNTRHPGRQTGSVISSGVRGPPSAKRPTPSADFLSSDSPVSSPRTEETAPDPDTEEDAEADSEDDTDEADDEAPDCLDLRSVEFNSRLLGPWITVPVVCQLLRIVYFCTMGKWASVKSAQALIAASLPIFAQDLRRRFGFSQPPPPPPPLPSGPSATGPSVAQQFDPPPFSLHLPQPHWCLNWLLYQASGLSHPAGLLALRRLAGFILEASVNVPQSAATSPTLMNGFELWTVCGVANLLFLGPSVEDSVKAWLCEYLRKYAALSPAPPPKFGLIALLSSMARISVGRTSRSAGTGPFQDPKQVPPQAGPFIPGPPMGGSAMRHGPPLLGGPLGPAYPLPPRGPVNVSGCPPPGPMSLGPARAPPSPWWRGPLGPPPQHPSGYPSPGDPTPFRPRHFSPVPPPPGPRYPPPPPESFSTGFVPAQPFPPFPAPYSAAETGLFPDLVEDSPQLRYLRQICAGLRSACVSALVATLRSLRHEELFRVVYWQLHCFSPTDVEELKEAVVDAVFASQASSGAQLLEFLLDLSCIPLGESAPESEVQARASLQFASRSILKAICNRAWQRLTTSRLPSLEEDGRDDQGFFEALDLLTTSSAPISSLLTNFSGGGLLMHRLISNSCQASGRLLILHSVARNPGLAEIIFSNLICWEERPDSPHDNACPLLYFFPLILEWESVSISYSSAVAEVSQSALSRGVSPGEKLLRRVLERILFRGPEIAWLRNLLWLTRRELVLSGGGCGRSAPSPPPPFRLLPALATLLPRLISLLPCGPISDDAVDCDRDKNLQVISMTLDLIHLALNHRCRNIPDSRPTASPLCFAPRESVTMGCRLMDALVNLLNRIEDLRSLDSLPGLLSLLVRCQDLLQKLTNADHLICSAALTTLAQSAVSRLTASHTSTQRPLSVTAPAEALKHAEPVNLPKDFFFEPSEMGGGRNDWKRLTSPKGENLLLSSPPSLVPDIVPRVGLPPATNRRFFTVSPPKDHDDWLPVWRLWTNMVGRLLRPQTSEALDDGNIYWQRRHLLGQALEDALLPLGARLPQTSISTLPTPLLLVTQPTGTGLERTLRLLRLFLPDRVNGVQGSIGGRREDNSRRILWGLLELVVSHTDTISSPSSLPVGGDEAAKTPTEVAPSTAAPAQLRPLSLWPQAPQPLFPLVRVVIGLLAGLEVSWASSLAPKIPFRGLPSPASSDPNDPTSPVQIALGVFPLLGLPEVSRARVNKLLVDFSHRRVDPSSPLYRATAFLLSLILPICHFGDVRLAADMLAATSAAASNGGEECGGSQPTQPLPALEPLLSRLTPRELAAALSDIRRNLRLRAGFDWFHRTSLARSPAPPPPPNPPPFITPGLLIALGQSHLMETPGIPDAFGGLLRSMLLCQFRAPTVSGRIAAIFDRRECDIIVGSGVGGGGAPGANGADNEAARERESSAEPLAEGLEEIDVDGEMMIVIDS